ncbi:hypothetical protein JW988_05305 [Candidatus Bathyarchaeota archaeon]|nr:hypothetical protein [Candidatus Bathyarchaeota archaeon]
MVNVDRFKRKLPNLLCDGDTSQRKHNNTFMRNRHRLQQFIRRDPERFNTLASQLVYVLEKIDKELSTII